MDGTGLEILEQAIARNLAMVLSLPSAGMLRHHKSRLLKSEGDGFWVESVLAEQALIEALVASGEPVGISFRASQTKVVFASPILRLDPALAVNALTQVPAVLVKTPAQIKAVQRRENYRVRITIDDEISVRSWKMAEGAHLSDRPLASQELITQISDLSVGGMGVVLQPRPGRELQLASGQRLRIEMKWNETELIVEGRLRDLNRPDDQSARVRTGISFKLRPGDLDDRRKASSLSRLIGKLQRAEARRTLRGA